MRLVYSIGVSTRCPAANCPLLQLPVEVYTSLGRLRVSINSLGRNNSVSVQVQ